MVIQLYAAKKNVEINKRKFIETRKELYNFLTKHKNIFEVSALTYKTEIEEWKQVVALECFENFIKLDEFLKYISEKTEIKLKYPKTAVDIHFDNSFYNEDLQKSIKTILELRKYRNLHNEDINKFFDNNFLVDKVELNTKCSSYGELQAYIKKRKDDYLQSKVSSQRINEFLFILHDSTEGFGDEKCCAVCVEDYQED